jgi:hypothetical protein
VSSDVALLYLDADGPVASLPVALDRIEPPEDGLPARLVGFGVHGASPETYEYDGRKRQGLAIAEGVVTEATPEQPAVELERLFGVRGQDALANGCFGDSGGPLFVDRGRCGEEVVGVASFVDDPLCAQNTFYARLEPAREMIDHGLRDSGFARVSPVLECVSVNPDGTLTAHWGYLNRNKLTVERTGLWNRVHPAPFDGAQPTRFAPGRVRDAWQTTFQPWQVVVWRVGVSTATASAHPAQRCR